jgi:hypothetical protein
MDQMLSRTATPEEALLLPQNTMLFQENCVHSQLTGIIFSMEKKQ